MLTFQVFVEWIRKTNVLGAKSVVMSCHDVTKNTGSSKALLKALLAEAIGTGLIVPWILITPVWLEMKVTSHLFFSNSEKWKKKAWLVDVYIYMYV